MKSVYAITLGLALAACGNQVEPIQDADAPFDSKFGQAEPEVESDGVEGAKWLQCPPEPFYDTSRRYPVGQLPWKWCRERDEPVKEREPEEPTEVYCSSLAGTRFAENGKKQCAKLVV